MNDPTLHDPAPLSPPGRSRRIFFNVLILHILAVFVPLLILYMRGFFKPEDPAFTVNLVETPSTGPVTGPETQRLPPAPEPTPESNPDPAPEPLPELPVPAPQQPQPRPVAEPVVPNLPMPMPRPPKTVREPQLTLPQVPVTKKEPVKKPPRRSADNSRKLSDSRKKTPRTGNNTNELVPIGKADVAQKFGDRFSNTPQGGPNRADSYAGTLAAFLKMQWATYVPSRAQLGDRKPEVKIALTIAGNGNVISARIVQASGVPAMDAAVRRMLGELRRFPAPPNGKTWSHQDIVLDTSDTE